jgi:hypothetical protein
VEILKTLARKSDKFWFIVASSIFVTGLSLYLLSQPGTPGTQAGILIVLVAILLKPIVENKRLRWIFAGISAALIITGGYLLFQLHPFRWSSGLIFTGLYLIPTTQRAPWRQKPPVAAPGAAATAPGAAATAPGVAATAPGVAATAPGAAATAPGVAATAPGAADKPAPGQQ